jgi:hypothetical protein
MKLLGVVLQKKKEAPSNESWILYFRNHI